MSAPEFVLNITHKSLRTSHGQQTLSPPIIRFYLVEVHQCSYPVRKFGGIQLLDGSINRSPLYSNMTNDLQVTIFRVLTHMQTDDSHLLGTPIT